MRYTDVHPFVCARGLRFSVFSYEVFLFLIFIVHIMAQRFSRKIVTLFLMGRLLQLIKIITGSEQKLSSAQRKM